MDYNAEMAHSQFIMSSIGNPTSRRQNQHDKIQNNTFCSGEYLRINPKRNPENLSDDYYKLYINGQLSSRTTTAYAFRYFCNKIDVKYLHEGENTIAIHTYYQGLINRVWVSGDNSARTILT